MQQEFFGVAYERGQDNRRENGRFWASWVSFSIKIPSKSLIT
jgi:hypothetical protein